MTPRQLIIRSLTKAGVNGVGKTPSTMDMADALDDLNDLFGQWQRKRWMIMDLVEVVFSPTGKTAYTVGPTLSCDLIMARPDVVSDAFVRLNPDGRTPVDYRLDVIGSQEDYNEIVIKNLGGLSSAVYYDPGYPQGTVYIWPVPQGNGATEIHLFFKNNQFVKLGLDDNINLPAEYNEALLYNLSARLRVSYQLPVDQAVVALAMAALGVIRQANVQVPEMDLPSSLPGKSGWGSSYAGLYAAGVGGGAATFRVDISPLDGRDTLL